MTERIAIVCLAVMAFGCCIGCICIQQQDFQTIVALMRETPRLVQPVEVPEVMSKHAGRP